MKRTLATAALTAIMLASCTPATTVTASGSKAGRTADLTVDTKAAVTWTLGSNCWYQITVRTAAGVANNLLGLKWGPMAGSPITGSTTVNVKAGDYYVDLTTGNRSGTTGPCNWTLTFAVA